MIDTVITFAQQHYDTAAYVTGSAVALWKGVRMVMDRWNWREYETKKCWMTDGDGEIFRAKLRIFKNGTLAVVWRGRLLQAFHDGRVVRSSLRWWMGKPPVAGESQFIKEEDK